MNSLIIINKAVLHILDFNSGVTVFSDKELTIENSVETFLLKHIEKAYYDQNLKLGTFYEDSVFKEKFNSYINEELNFIDFSRNIVEVMYNTISKSDKMESTDLLVCDLILDDERFLALFKCNNRIGFIHQVIQTDEGIKNDIINNFAIMPNLTQKIDEYAFISALSQTIKFVDKKSSIDGEEAHIIADYILECSFTASPKTTMETVNLIAKKVAENHGRNSVETITKAKAFIAENTQVSEYLEPMNLGKQIFSDSPIMQEEYFSEIKSSGLADAIKIDRDFALKKTKSHKIKTDTGIEINIPVDYFQNKDYVEFINNPDGTLSINLKNIGKLINK